MALGFVGALPDDRWHEVFSHYLAVADRWALHMPAGDGPLSNGREVFAALPGVEAGRWGGMRDAVRLTGPLTEEARSAFRSAEPSLLLLDPGRKLWDYQLLLGGSVVLQVSDFTDLLIDEAAGEVLGRLGISRDDVAS